MKNELQTNQLDDHVERLITARNVWQKGTKLASDLELYQVLGDCAELLEMIGRSVNLGKHLNERLRLAGTPCNAGTSLATRIVRCVFGKMPQEAVYAKVVRLAAKEKPAKASMSEWINANGGIYGLSRRNAKGESRANVRTADIEFADKHFSDAKPLVALPHSIVTLTPDNATGRAYSVALVRTINGQQEVVFGSNREAIVNEMLHEAGKAARANVAAAQITTEATNRSKRVSAVIQSLAEDGAI